MRLPAVIDEEADLFGRSIRSGSSIRESTTQISQSFMTHWVLIMSLDGHPA